MEIFYFIVFYRSLYRDKLFIQEDASYVSEFACFL